MINDIANSIDSMITMTFDIPSKYNDSKVPMLDLKVWLNANDNYKIYYSFYEKPTKCQLVMSKMSAMPIRKKIEFLSEEVFRRLHNTKREIDENEKVSILNKFMIQLKLSGYSEYDRYQILESGFNHYDKLLRKELDGICPFY